MNLLLRLPTLLLSTLVFGHISNPDGAVALESAASSWAETEQTRLRLVAASPTVGTGEVTLGLQFDLKPNWKVYWRSPGDAGFPPSVDWKGSTNLKSARLDWPAPTRFSVLGLETLGYKKQVVLPISAEVVSASTDLGLKAHVRYLACNEICIPYDADLALSMPAGPAQSSPHAHLINRYASSVPGDGKAHGLDIAALGTWKRDDNVRLRISVTSHSTLTAPDAFIEGPPGLNYSKPIVRLNDGGKAMKMDIVVGGLVALSDDTQKSLAGKRFTVTIVDGNRAAELMLAAEGISPPSTAPLANPTYGATAPSLALILVFALIGGLILNLMPCVLPVLSLKMLSLVKHGGGDPREVSLGFLASAAGIISTFLVLAASLAALRAGGAVIGWGIQFQQPWFLTFLVLTISIFACNLWGFFEVRLPMFVSNLGEHGAHVHGLGGHFLQGSFATLLATPCTAPFLGTAVGFALVGSTFDTLAIFFALGVGLALPYLGVAAFPALATWLPKPGTWMLRLKAFLGLLLAGTGVWLLFVLAGVTGRTGALVVGTTALAGGILLFIAHKEGGKGLRLSGPGLAALLIVALVTPLWASTTAKSNGQPGENETLKAIWKPLDPAAIPGIVAAGKTVFVDVTADWCITCLINKGVVMEGEKVLARLGENDVIAMQADWTRPNEDISRYLASFGRFGIPFNVVYGPKEPSGFVLPELLTKSAVMQAFDKAADFSALVEKK